MLTLAQDDHDCLRVEGTSFVRDTAPAGATLHILPETNGTDEWVGIYAMADGIVYAITDVYPEYLARNLALLSGARA